MQKQFSYEDESWQEWSYLFEVALKGKALTPVYSGDIALALQIPHRLVKDRIEGQYRGLKRAYFRRVYHVKHKRSREAKALNGYILPMKAMVQVLAPIARDIPSLHTFYSSPTVLYVAFAGEANFLASLN